MARVLITGMSGAGKSTILERLRARGYPVVDTDYDGWELPGALWDEPRMHTLLSTHRTIAVSGAAENQGRFYDRFEHVVCLVAAVDVLLERARNRTNNPYGKSPGQQEDIVRYATEVEPLLRRTATCELDATLPVETLTDEVERLLRTP